MKISPDGTRILAAAAFVALGLAPRVATAAEETILCEVRDVYVQLEGSRHLYVQQDLSRHPSEPIHVEVVPRVQNARPILAVVSPGLHVAARDIIELQIASPLPRYAASGLLQAGFDEVGASPAAPTGTVTRVVERRGIVRRDPEIKAVAEGGRLFVRAVIPVEPTRLPIAVASSTPAVP